MAECFWQNLVLTEEDCENPEPTGFVYVSQEAVNSSTFGSAIAVSGEYVAAGDRYASAAGKTKKGTLTLYENVGGILTERDSFTSSVVENFMELGCSVDMDGTHIVVGEIGASGQPGAAYVLTYAGGTLTQTQALAPSDSTTGDDFGALVAISGDYIAVRGSNVSNQPKVYIFHLSGGTWTEEDTITLPSMGWMTVLTMDNDTLVFADPLANEGGGSSSGAVYVYTRSGASWSLQATLVSSDTEPDLGVGYTAVLRGDYILASAANNATYVFERDGTWSEIAILAPPAGTLYPGVAAATFDLEYILIAGIEDYDTEYNDLVEQQKLFVFQQGLPGEWEFVQTLTPSLEEVGITFSTQVYRPASVALEDGYLFAGSSLSDDDGMDRFISVYSYPV